MTRKKKPSELIRHPREEPRYVHTLAHQFFDFWKAKGHTFSGQWALPRTQARELFNGTTLGGYGGNSIHRIRFPDGSSVEADDEKVYEVNRGRMFGPSRRNGHARAQRPEWDNQDLTQVEPVAPDDEGELVLL